MSAYMQATRAYQTSSESRSLRAQEADIFHRANGALRTALNGTEIDRVRAVADNRRLWLTVLGLVRAGLGVGIVPGIAVPRPLARGIALLPITGPKLVREVGIITQHGRPLSPVAAELTRLLEQRLQPAHA